MTLSRISPSLKIQDRASISSFTQNTQKLTGPPDDASIIDESNVSPKTYGDYAFVVAKPQNDNYYLQAFNIPNIINRAKEYQLQFGQEQDEDIIIYNEFGH